MCANKEEELDLVKYLYILCSNILGVVVPFFETVFKFTDLYIVRLFSGIADILAISY